MNDLYHASNLWGRHCTHLLRFEESQPFLPHIYHELSNVLLMVMSSTSHDASLHIKNRVKCTLVQALRICTGRTAHRRSRGIALLFLDHGTRRGWGVSVKPRPLFTSGKDPVSIVQEALWAPGPVWTGAENLAPTGIRSPDRPARSQSLYRLSYRPTLHIFSVIKRKMFAGRPSEFMLRNRSKICLKRSSLFFMQGKDTTLNLHVPLNTVLCGI